MYSALHEMIIEKAQENKDKTAIIDEAGNAFTYSDLLSRSAYWSNYILALGLSPGEKVGIAVTRHALLPCLLLAVSRAGCTWVPLDPAYPAQWREFVIRDADIGLVLHDELLAHDMPVAMVKYINVLTAGAQSEHTALFERNINPDDICYIIYTSGSTGVPKGVLIKHENTVNFIEWARETYTAEELARVICCTSICFDLSLFEIFATLSAGGTCFMVSNALAILSIPASYRPTLINTVPSVMREILRHQALPHTDPLVVNLAGEALSGELVSALYQQPNVTRVVNLYGPSETTTYSTWDVVPRNEKTPTIGKPIKDTQIYLLDDNLKPVANGTPGEIYISGKGVAAGYINRPDITRERFITLFTPEGSPFLAYKTGDIGRSREDGRLDYAGRADDQVKVRGFRIELQQIEETLVHFDEIAEAAVVAAFPGEENVSLVGWLVVNTSPESDTRKIRESLKEKLPEYMIPARFFIEERLPKLPNGKIDRKTLRLQSEARLKQNGHRPNKQADAETFLLSLFSQLTGEPAIMRHTDIFSLGINSLSILKITAEIKARFGILLPNSVISLYPTVSGLIDYLSAITDREKEPLPVPDLTESQQQMYYLSQLTDNSSANNVCFSVTLAAGASEKEVIMITDTLYHAFPLMRAMIPTGDKWELQADKPQIKFFRGRSNAEDLHAIEHEAAHEIIDPALSGLWRISAIFNQHAAPVVFLTFHHLLIDDESLQLIFHTIHSALIRGQQVKTVPLARIDNCTDREHQNRLWWFSALEKIKYTTASLTVVNNDIDWFDTRALRSSCSLQTSLYQQIGKLCQQARATLYEFLLSALVPVLQKNAGDTAITIGTIMSTRDALATHGQAGFYATPVPLILPFLTASSWQTNLEMTRRCVRATRKHAFVSANWLQDELRRRLPASSALMMFGCIRHFADRIERGVAQAKEINTGHSHPVLNFQARFDENSVQLFLDGRASIYSQSELDLLLRQWVESITSVVNAYSTEGK
ncbi:amino acid adenylation domain-containing protein [Pantoea agglomerans]|uniref:amino acid adenylation domain-containing protein n=1 Tax=Enterobacter agglomerans TaxID=549 RepID=UPI00289F003C|nr:amino acid adenylation domain-containing protein [Pantoea agglomerans]WNK36095.1 amino acid adenylation domain-containing protein [Pantoea agglomerans]